MCQIFMRFLTSYTSVGVGPQQLPQMNDKRARIGAWVFDAVIITDTNSQKGGLRGTLTKRGVMIEGIDRGL